MCLPYWLSSLLLLLVSFSSLAQNDEFYTLKGDARQPQHQVIFQADFTIRRELRQWDTRPSRRWATITKDSTGNSLLRVRSTGRTRALARTLPLDQVRGRKLLLRVRLKADSITGRSASYRGVKVMLHIDAPQGHLYPQLKMPYEPQPWQYAGFTAYVPADARSCTLILGIEEAIGEAFFDDLSIAVLPKTNDSTHPTTVQMVPVVQRGAMISTNASAEDLKTLASWGANHLRWQLTWDGFPDSPADLLPLDAYTAWLRSSLAHVKSLMPLCDSLGISVLLDLHTLPGGRRRSSPGQEHRIFTEMDAQEAFRAAWREIAQQFRDEPALWGYDLANEPLEGSLPDSLYDWQGLAAASAADIRQLDAKHFIVLQGAPTGSPEVLPGLNPIGDSKTVYSCHMYEPALFTHQGLDGLPVQIQYPGTIDGKYWDKEALTRFLQPVRDWQLKHRVPIYIGEFSAIRWAPDSSAFRYLRDCIDIFEAWGWSWAYHAFRESHVWSVEHDNNPNNKDRSPTPSDRQLLLQEYYKRNKKD